MKWVLVLCLCVGGCTDQPPRTVTGSPGSGPGVGVGGGGSGGSAGADGGVDGGTDGGEPQGACDNESDLEALEGVGDDGRDIARICGLPNSNSLLLCLSTRPYEQCIAECVEDEVPGLSTECAACYGALERCSRDSFCQTRCQFNGCSAPCLDCLSLAGCIEEYEECRGIPGDDCPTPP